MALKVLLMRNKAATKKKLLEELRSKDEGFQTREQELEASIAEMDESTPEADRKVVEDAVEDLTKEKDAHEAAKKKLEDEIEELENKIKEQESIPPEPQAGDDQGASQNSRSKRGKDRDMETRTEFFGRTMQERSAIFANEEVKDFMQQVRSCIKEKRAIGNAGLIIPQNFLPMIKEVTEANSKLLKYTNKSDITGTARITIMGSVPEAVWTEQCGKLNELELGFNDVEMDGFKVAGFFKVCNALLEDNDVNLAQELINALGIAIAKAKDKAIVYGTGVKMPMGIVTRLAQTVKPSDHNDTEREWKDLHESNIKKIENKTGKELFKEIVRCLKMIFTDYDSGNLVWMMNRQTKLDLVVEAMDTNMNATIVSGMNDTMPVVGGKVEELKFMADGDIAFGYMTNYKAVQRKGLQLGQSEHVRFLEDQTVFKGTERFDGKPVIAEAFGLININGKTPTTSIVFAPDKANEEDVQLASLKIGSNKLFPVFSAGTYEYMVNTSNASSKIEVVAKRAGAVITIKNGVTPVNNGETASFTDGENTLSITVSFAGVEKEYIVTVNKSAAA
ncbi:phage major capsid protein [Clostridium sp. HGF2]|uniref:phage major capsid protein n=1 Tax=Clostridium sp. HGF2 TaxID=908340 RepID=UPI0001EB1F85|nr:putative phage major capsid protein, HK97 family [Clostridium sp. HGF2]